MNEFIADLKLYEILIFSCWFISVLVFSYKLALNKTLKVKQAVIIGGVTAIIPPLAIIYLLSLYFRTGIKPFTQGSKNDST